jgi:hypothetical protein
MVGKKLFLDNPPKSKVTKKEQSEPKSEKPERQFNPNTIKHIIQRSCLIKKNLSFEKANQVVDRAAKEGRAIYFYECQFCGSYHMTRKNPTDHTQRRLVVI